MNPLVSIIIPCHNAAPWLAETLRSALAQTWKNCEVIVVDDGSTDDSAAIAAREPVTLIRQSNRGAAAARNAGLAHATGEFIQFLDADDLLALDKIEYQIKRLTDHPPGFVASAAWARFRDTPDVSFVPEPVWCDALPLNWLLTSWLGGGMMHPAAWLTPAAVIRAVGPWNETLSLDDDGEYFTRVLLASSGVLHCREAQVYYRTHVSGSLSQMKSPAAWQSSHEVCCLVQTHALAHEDSLRVRRACALNHLRFAIHAWPYPAAQKFACISLKEAHRLDPAARRPMLGARFEMLAKVVGWKRARIIQHHWLHA